jgi:hypothetical protein
MWAIWKYAAVPLGRLHPYVFESYENKGWKRRPPNRVRQYINLYAFRSLEKAVSAAETRDGVNIDLEQVSENLYHGFVRSPGETPKPTLDQIIEEMDPDKIKNTKVGMERDLLHSGKEDKGERSPGWT